LNPLADIINFKC